MGASRNLDRFHATGNRRQSKRGQKEEAMPRNDDERRTQLLAELEQQNLAWKKVRMALGQMGGAVLPVPRSFFEELDALGPLPAPAKGIRG
jgi:hypothetical protein